MQRRVLHRFFEFLCGLWCSCIRKGAELPPRPQVSSYVTTDERFANHKSDIEQLEREQRDVAPSSKRSRLFKAVVETPLLDLRDKFRTEPAPITAKERPDQGFCVDQTQAVVVFTSFGSPGEHVALREAPLVVGRKS